MNTRKCDWCGKKLTVKNYRNGKLMCPECLFKCLVHHANKYNSKELGEYLEKTKDKFKTPEL